MKILEITIIKLDNSQWFKTSLTVMKLLWTWRDPRVKTSWWVILYPIHIQCLMWQRHRPSFWISKPHQKDSNLHSWIVFRQLDFPQHLHSIWISIPTLFFHCHCPFWSINVFLKMQGNRSPFPPWVAKYSVR